MKMLIAALVLALCLAPCAMADTPTTLEPGTIIPLPNEATIDLDRDGQPDTVTFTLTDEIEFEPREEGEHMYGGYILRVNDLEVTGTGEFVMETLYAMSTDNPRDVMLLVGDYGSSDYQMSHCYVYQDGMLYDAGVIGTSPADIQIHPGLFTGYTHGHILQSWSRPADYTVAHRYSVNDETGEFTDAPMVVEVPRAIYPMGTVVQLGRDIDLKLSPAADAQVALTLKAGESAIIAASDDVAWIYIQAIEEREESRSAGWFYVGTDTWSGIPVGDEIVAPRELFEGLLYAG